MPITPSESSDRLLTTTELSEIIGIKPGTLNRARITGDKNFPPFIKINSSVRYRTSSVLKWIADQEELHSTSQLPGGNAP